MRPKTGQMKLFRPINLKQGQTYEIWLKKPIWQLCNQLWWLCI